MTTPVLHWLSVASVAHLFLAGKRSSVCGHIVQASTAAAPARFDRRCGHCLRPIPRCPACFRSVDLRADGTAKRHPKGSPQACSGTGRELVVATDLVRQGSES